jgi:heptosyltransferase-2
MTVHQARIPADQIVVFMPNWLGDAVMATPFLRALHHLYPAAHLAAVARPLVAPVLAGLGAGEPGPHNGLPWVREVKTYRRGEEKSVIKWMRDQNFDLGILLPNSFRSAWMMWRGSVKARLGYARGGRSWLLTHRIAAMPRTPAGREADRKKAAAIRTLGGGRVNVGSGFEPIPTLDYYLELAAYLGARVGDGGGQGMQLGITPQEAAEASSLLDTLRPDPVVTLVPGANFGSSKCWPPERYAQVADALANPAGPYAARVLLASSPAELPIVDAILNAATHKNRLIPLAKLNTGKGLSIGALKELVRRSALMVCNDTGPRHFAAAFNIPTVTLFGPTDPVWAETYSPNERIVRVDVPCGPCQLKKCPIDHRCMRDLAPDMVLTAIAALWHNRLPPTSPVELPLRGTAPSENDH